MARTFKDQPRHVKAVKAMRAGKIDHEHHRLGLPEQKFATSYYTSSPLAKIFAKADTAGIRAHEELLASLPDVTYEREEREGYRTTAPGYSFSDPWAPQVTVPKSVAFIVTSKYTLVATSAYCTDAAHYDAATGTDTRDGKRAVCTPDARARGLSRRCRCDYCTAKKQALKTGSSDRARFAQLKKLYNSGAPAEECDDTAGAPAQRLSHAAMC